MMYREFIDEIVEMRLLSERMAHRLTESEAETRRKELLNEMAFYRKDFKYYLMSITTAFISHYALVKYITLTHNTNPSFEHWKTEVKNMIIDIQQMDTKPKSGNRSMVERALTEAWVDGMNLSGNRDDIKRRFRNKFKEEGIDEASVEDEIVEAFLKDIPTIIHEMAYGTEETATAFVNKI